jgi:hypothetical protein
VNIDWAAFGTVFGATVVATVGLVGLFTLGIVGVSKQQAADGGAVRRVSGYACFALCVAAVAYGIYLIAG